MRTTSIRLENQAVCDVANLVMVFFLYDVGDQLYKKKTGYECGEVG